MWERKNSEDVSCSFFLFLYYPISAKYQQRHFVNFGDSGIDCMVAVLSKNKTCPRGEERLLHSEGLLSRSQGRKRWRLLPRPSGRECSQGRRLDHEADDTVGEDQNPLGTPQKERCTASKQRRRKGGGGSGERQAEPRPERQQVLENTHLTNLPNIIKKGWFYFQMQKWWLIRWALYLKHVEWIMVLNGCGKYLTEKETKNP